MLRACEDTSPHADGEVMLQWSSHNQSMGGGGVNVARWVILYTRASQTEKCVNFFKLPSHVQSVLTKIRLYYVRVSLRLNSGNLRSAEVVSGRRLAPSLIGAVAQSGWLVWGVPPSLYRGLSAIAFLAFKLPGG